MACTSCSTGSGGAPRGCKSNGTCGTDSCNKLTVFDWLGNMSLPGGQKPFDCVEVRFKNGRKDFYRNTDLTLSIGDVVATEASPGHDIGIVTLTGELVKMQMKKKGADPESGEVLKIYRKATQKDVDIWQAARNREEPMKVIAREIAIRLNLEMKISDIEFQGDASKATFYYTANDRVDFRQLIKDYAREFSIRIEMKQVGFRQEASRLGGVGSCGRELCCSTWLTDFRSVNTSAARYQQLSLNPQKLAGQCGKLKCCLNFELDTYLDALKELPDMDTRVYTQKGEAICQKIDIFKGMMWFAYLGDTAHWHMLEAEQVREMIQMNRKNEPVSALEDYVLEEEESEEKAFMNAVGQDSLTRFDAPKHRRKKPSRGRDKDRTETVGSADAPVRERNNRQGNDRNNNRGDRPNNRIVPNTNPDRAATDKPQRDNNRQPRENRQPRDGQPREDRQPRDNREPKGERQPREPREPRAERPQGDNRQPREPRENREPRQPREPRAERPQGEERQPREPRENREPRQPREPRGERPQGEERQPRENRQRQPRPQRDGDTNRQNNQPQAAQGGEQPAGDSADRKRTPHNRNKKKPSSGDNNGNDQK